MEKKVSNGMPKRKFVFYDSLFLLPLILVFGVSLASILLFNATVWVDLIFDDAYYYLGIARSLVETHQSQFLPPFTTNGYQPLWQLVLWGSAELFGTSEKSLVIQALALNFIFVALFCAASRVRYGFAAPAVLATLLFPFVMIMGMETAMLPVFAICFFEAKNWKYKGIFGSLIFLTRLDALSIVLAGELVTVISRRRMDVKPYYILLPVAILYAAMNFLCFGIPVPVSGLMKEIGNLRGQNLLVLVQYAFGLKYAFAAFLIFVFTSLTVNGNLHWKYQREILVLVFVQAFCAAYYWVNSGWLIWGWYCWPGMMLAFYLLLETQSVIYSGFEKYDYRLNHKLLLPLLLCSYFLAAPAQFIFIRLEMLLGPKSGIEQAESYGVKNIAAVEALKKHASPRGTYFAMGDRAGSFGFFLGNTYKFFHTEGLVGPVAYYRAMEKDEGEKFIESEPIQYLLVDRSRYLGAGDIIGVIEPIQGISARIGPYLLCFPHSAIVAETIYAQGHRYMFDFRRRTECPGGFAGAVPCTARGYRRRPRVQRASGNRQHIRLPSVVSVELADFDFRSRQFHSAKAGRVRPARISVPCRNAATNRRDVETIGRRAYNAWYCDMWTRFRCWAVLALLPEILAACAPTPTRPTFHTVSETAAPLATSPSDLALLNRISWGAETAEAQSFAAEGATGYLDRQLHPPEDDGLPADAKNEIAAMEISRKSVVTLMDEARALQKAAREAKGTPDADAAQKAYQQNINRLAGEAQTRSLLRDLYSKNQLKEQLTWFWFNHFNVNQNKADIRVLIGDYEENTIRPHVLGKFVTLLSATVIDPAMLQYLDNSQNAKGHLNENYAREIMELHTLGVGSGYTQKDVQELARILTGLGVNFSGHPPKIPPALQSYYRSKNLFEFNPARHDFGDKQFLGVTIKGEGIEEVENAVAILAAEPPTAHHVSAQLAQYFCCDDPPESLVHKMVLAWQATDGDISEVLHTMFTAPEFAASLGRKFKDPVHYAVSALRVAYGEQVILNSKPLLNWLNRMSEPLFSHDPPDGYAMTQAAWSGPGEMETRFEIARQIGLGHSGLYKSPDDPPTVKEPAPAPIIQQTRYYQAVAPTLSPATLSALGEAKSPADRNMLFLASPEFMYR